MNRRGMIMAGAMAVWACTMAQAADEPVYTQDFSDAASAGEFVFASPAHWKRVQVGDRWALEHEHAGAAYKPPHRSPHNIALIATHRFGSFVLEYEVQQTSRAYGHRDACVFFNVVDPANYYYAHIATKSDPHAHQIMLVDDAPRKAITRQGTSGFDWGAKEMWHKVRIVRDLESGRIAVYVDDFDKPIMQAEDKTHGLGYIGFGSFDDTGRVTNIKVWSKDAEAKRCEFFERRDGNDQ